jgi:hypothetical protein
MVENNCGVAAFRDLAEQQVGAYLEEWPYGRPAPEYAHRADASGTPKLIQNESRKSTDR